MIDNQASKMAFNVKTYWVIVAFYFITLPLWVDFRGAKTPFSYDIDQYYSYLPAIFVHGDLTFSFSNNYWLHDAGEGKFIQRFTVGLSILHAPFFLIGHGFAWLLGEEMSGYSMPYVYAICYGTVIYFALGLWFLRKLLLKFFDDFTTASTLIAIALATNLLYYTLGTGQMSHAYLFTLYAVFLYCSISWLNTFTWKYSILSAIALGLAALIRPTEIILILVPILWGLRSKTDINERIKHIGIHFKQILIFGIIVFLIGFIQFIYWKLYGGNWIIYSYGEEGFNFKNPQILNVLFSYRKGLFIYTPIMFLAFVGIIMLFKRLPQSFWSILVFCGVYIYVISSWWSWWYGGGFGMRAMIQTYALLAIPLAVFISFAINRLRNKKLIYLILVPFIFLNFLQTYQYKKTFIHWENMTKEAYWVVFGKFKLSDEDWEKVRNAYKPPEVPPKSGE